MGINKMLVEQDELLLRRQAWGRLFCSCVEKTREAGGRSVAEAAQLAGMETSGWAAIEAGYVPDPAKLRPMADVLEIGYDKIATLALLCCGAWEQ